MRNTAEADKWNTIKHAKFSKKIFSNREKMERAQGNKKEMDEKRRHDNITSLNKWAVFRKKREKIIKEYVKIIWRQRCYTKLVKILGLREHLKVYMEKFKARIKVVIYRLKTRFIAFRST